MIETGKPFVRNFITQSAVVQGLRGCKGRDWFDSISGQPLSDFGLPFMSSDEVRAPPSPAVTCFCYASDFFSSVSAGQYLI